MSLWIFGYGSLIWRPGFEYLERRPARLAGWQRRFWQGSHDHRGVPERPGRVVTLVRTGEGHCDGMAYRVDRSTVTRVFENLDHREKNGYQRFDVGLQCHTDPTEVLDAVVYIAPTDNFAYLGPAPIDQIARQIATSHGPSGSNRDYLLELAEALRDLDVHDEHVFELESAVRSHPS
jgi:cation transport regulator ChaC